MLGQKPPQCPCMALNAVRCGYEKYRTVEHGKALLCLVNGTLCELHKTLREECTLELITIHDEIGRSVYNRSLNFLFLKALHDVLHDDTKQAVLHFSNGNGYYYTVEGLEEIDEEFVEKVRGRMRRLVEEHIPIRKEKVKTSYAKKVFSSRGMTDKEELFRYRRGSQVNIYSLQDYTDYFYGYMVWNTGYLTVFDLERKHRHDRHGVRDDVVGRVGFEPTVFPMSRFYRPLASASLHTYPCGCRDGIRTRI